MRDCVYRGTRFAIAFAEDQSGQSPGQAFFEQLDIANQAKLMALFRILADHGSFSNPEKFGDLGNGLYEFKSHQIRMPFAYSKKDPGLILITHGFVKKKDKAPRSEIDRARRIFQADQARRPNLALVKKAKS